MQPAPVIDFSLQHEEAARAVLTEHYRKSYGDRVDGQVDLLLDLHGYASRFNYLRSILGTEVANLPRILISGYGAGSEMIIARQYGFPEIHGVEVDPALLEATQARLAGIPGMFPALYDGSTLLFDDARFDLVLSGHIIEHTFSPREYLRESMRVIRPGGILYLEFPTRYHHIELHTRLVSFEWMPTFARNAILRLLSSRRSPLRPSVKLGYESILTTKLRQVGRNDVLRWLRQLGISYSEVAHAMPEPGIIRTILRKLLP